MCGWKAVAGKTQKGSKWGQETTADVTLLRWNWSSVSNCSYFLRINFGSKMGVTYTKTIYVFKCKRKATQLKNNLTHHCCHGKAFAFEERPLLFSKERSLLSLTVAPIPHPELIMGYWLIQTTVIGAQWIHKVTLSCHHDVLCVRGYQRILGCSTFLSNMLD